MKSARLRCKRFSVAIKGILFFEKMLINFDMVMHFIGRTLFFSRLWNRHWAFMIGYFQT